MPPPPPYSSAVKTSSNTANADYDYDYDDDEDIFLEEDTSTRAPPITIKIDASISFVGDRNTITIPPVSRLVRSGSGSSNGDGSGSGSNDMQT